jgi:Mg-chelatase subunit ChlD
VDLQAYADALNELLNTPEVEQGQDRGNALQELIADAVGVSAAKRESTFVLPKVMLTLKGGGDAESITRVRAASIALRYRMDEFLEASKKTRRRASEKGKRLVRDAGIRLALGDTRLYEKRTPGQKVDTAVHVLLDISGSMIKEGRCKIALDAALALGIALQDTDGVSFSLSAFPFHDHDVVDVVLPGELVRDVAKRAALMVPNGTTPLDKGLLHAHTLLMTTPATRRVCMVVTDGQPDDLEAVKLLIEMGQADGIEYLGIGIRSPAQHITPNACLVTDLEDLPKQVIAMMQDVILLPKAA